MSRSTFFLVSGIVLVIGGLLAALLPLAATLAVTLIVGWTFLFVGVLHLIAVFREEDHRAWNGLFGVASLLLGLSFLFNPLGGMMSLTALLGILFGASGILQLWLAWERREQDNVLWLALSGVVSLLLAVLIFSNFFAASATVPGLLLALELITTGVGLIMLRSKLAEAMDDAEAVSTAAGAEDGVSYTAKAASRPAAEPLVGEAEDIAKTRPIDPRTGTPTPKS